MKALLSIIAGAGILSTSFSSITYLTYEKNLNQNIDSESRESIFYFNDSTKNDWIVEAKATPWGAGTSASDHTWDWKTINLGQSKPEYQLLKFLGSANSEVKWGSAYWNYDIGQSIPLEFKKENNYKITSTDDAKKFTTILKYKDEKWSLLANIDAWVYLGYTWYKENSNYYLQVASYQFVAAYNSYTSVYGTANMSKGIILS
ncbi:hypothetical protein [Spiroplasma chrysopicola]|uniref:Uncharacterized protein n=1 Tax=Spiroplasma chrysopicola DF-1 TaxID=1276227 RepID=R4U3T0_9MOLU|nr:hypothetical protein [Spiroplasma chrysopicola]AGM25148.1 hypothetical protein SCHRY_v1c05700 [Spiroplasma chrysopicola DF-1]